jgi:hypothetical protein
MWSIDAKRATFGLWLATAASTAAAQEARCPSHAGGAPLSGAVLYDGSPEQRADPMPDAMSAGNGRAMSSWNVAYVYRQGRTVSIVCRYRGAPDAAPLVVETPVQCCRYRVPVGRGPAEMRCR